MKTLMTRLSWFFVAFLLVLPLAGCDRDEGPLEEAAEEIEDAVDDVTDEIDDAVDG